MARARHGWRASTDTRSEIVQIADIFRAKIVNLNHENLIIELTGSRSKIVHRPLPVDDPIQRCPDISQAKTLLDWQPRTPLRPGLEKTIAYFDQLLAGRGQPATRKAALA